MKKFTPFILGLLLLQSCSPIMPDYILTRQNHAAYDQCVLNDVETPDHPLTLGEVIEYALNNNLDVQLQKLEQRVQSQKYLKEKLLQLPYLTVEGELSKRNNTPAWFSKPKGGTVGDTPTVSTERKVKVFDITAAFNILDFGLTYLTTRQEKNKTMILLQQQLRTRQNLILDISSTYWDAMVAKMAAERARDLLADVDERILTLREEVNNEITAEMQGLMTESQYLEIKSKLSNYEKEFLAAKTELASLMGLPPGVNFELADVSIEELTPISQDICELESQSLLYRPELMAQEMQYAIDVDEVRASILRFFPHLDLFGSRVYDCDRFQFHNNWTKVGAYVSWDLLTLPSKHFDSRSAMLQRDLSWHSRLTLSMGILTQVHLALLNVREMEESYQLAKEMQDLKQRQFDIAKLMDLRGQIHTDDMISYTTESLFADIHAMRNYADLIVAREQLGNAIGRPLEFSHFYLNDTQKYQLAEPFEVDSCGMMVRETVPATEDQTDIILEAKEVTLPSPQRNIDARRERLSGY